MASDVAGTGNGREGLEIYQLEKSFLGRKVLRGIRFTARPGEILGLLGPNGAGKTTTLRIVGTLLKPDAGTVRVCGLDVREQPAQVRRCLGVVTASVGVYGRLTVEENLRYFGTLYGVRGRELDQRVAEVMAALGLERLARTRCERLSSGEVQRVAIARAVLHDPPVLLLDEPTSNLDVLAAVTVKEFMREARDRGRVVVFSTHVLHDAEHLCDRVVIVHEGRVVAEGRVEEILGQTGAGRLDEAFLTLVGARGGRRQAER